ncbi:hypothetical protein CupriaWKF_18120 [Cupriavidus sp. WKF15]|uniref:hypothetical protein n=1 Tax=Cupriavidus sp. WKF15 TaxID=3032282 RepID=UPI0023E35104|nr:hypothetical protein [Cupriavidus sp. WKF15]WER50189.1 hypothetical protein CupriaWKF_18120 [Cupriavidus sp. WKF15]
MRIRLAIVASLACVAGLTLGACSALQPEQTGQRLIGSDQGAVRSTFGEPTDTFSFPNGTSRWLYSGQPLGHTVYAADFDATGKLVGYRQMLTEAEIYQAQVGVWTKQDVIERFGKPREPTQYYPLMKREAWTYRMYKDGYQTAHFSCYFDENGVLQQSMIIVDPLGGDRRGHSR